MERDAGEKALYSEYASGALMTLFDALLSRRPVTRRILHMRDW
ncbi:MAG: hypothetical protein ACLUD2_07685 [Clostridium sp.]